MTQKKAQEKRATEELPAFSNGGALPGEEQWTDLGGDSSLFVRMNEVGDTFTGVFIRKVAKGQEDLKHPGLLFAEYPSGELKVLPDNWSIGNKIADMEDKGADPRKVVLRIMLTEIKERPDESTVKLYRYQAMPVPERFRPTFTDQFPETPRKHGE